MYATVRRSESIDTARSEEVVPVLPGRFDVRRRRPA